MNKNVSFILTGLVSAALLTGCGSKNEEEENEEASVSTSGAVAAVREMAKQAEEMEKKGPVETVDFRTLKELLPADADGLARKEATGEKSGAMGFNVSTATGKYGNADDSETVEVAIVDGGGASMMMGLAAWSMIEVDKETANGYEKTSKMGDYKTYEKYDNSDKNGEIAVLINNRFIVTAKGRGIDMDKLKTVLDDVDLDKLKDLK